jgi:hypothetical protein
VALIYVRPICRGADLAHSALPIWCGGTEMKIDDRLIYQIIFHFTHQNIDGCSDDVKSLLANIPKRNYS